MVLPVSVGVSVFGEGHHVSKGPWSFGNLRRYLSENENLFSLESMKDSNNRRKTDITLVYFLRKFNYSFSDKNFYLF